jgi:predicted dehydrogenase
LESYSARAEEGGVLRDLVHEIDYTGWLFGWPSATSASVRNLGRLGIEADEIANLHWETPNGCLVSVSLDFLSRTPKRQVVASGENGSIQWDGISQTVTVQPAASDTKVIHSSQSLEQLFAAQAQAFVGALRGDGDARLASGADGVRGLAICDAARRSSATRREEPVVYS